MQNPKHGSADMHAESTATDSHHPRPEVSYHVATKVTGERSHGKVTGDGERPGLKGSVDNLHSAHQQPDKNGDAPSQNENVPKSLHNNTQGTEPSTASQKSPHKTLLAASGSFRCGEGAALVNIAPLWLRDVYYPITDQTFLPHRFPKAETRPELRAAWINAIRRKNWKPSHNSFLCGDHFEKKCFVVRPGKIGTRLNESAIPSVFDFPAELPLNQASSRKQLADDFLSYKFPVELAASLDYVPELPDEPAIPEPEVVEIPDPAKVSERLKSEHSYTRKGEPVPPETVENIARLRHTIKMLNCRVRRKQRRINKMSVDLKCIDQWKQGELASKSNPGKIPKHMIILNQNQLEQWEVNCVEKCNDDDD